MKKQLFIAITLMTSSICSTHYRSSNTASADVTQASRQRLNNDLLDAIIYGDIENVQLAIKQGAEVNALDSIGFTPLIWGTRQARPEIVKILIQHGADISKPGTDGRTPIEHVQERIEDKQKELKTVSAGPNPKKEDVNNLRTMIEDLYIIGQLVSPAAPAPEAPAAPRPEQSAAASPEKADSKAATAAGSSSSTSTSSLSASDVESMDTSD